MGTKFCHLIALVFLAGADGGAQGAQFFRSSGPTAITITAFRPDGTIVWSNAQPGMTYTIQTVKSLPGRTNWVSYVQILATNKVLTNLLFSFNPPAGMTLIPAGKFTMGDNLDSEYDAATNSATVSGFYMDVNLVSYGQWQSVYNFATAHGYVFVDAGTGKATNYPVQMVDWYDTVKWCNARSQQAGLTPIYYTDTNLTQIYTNGETTNVFANWAASGYRLPTEAEWEKAARGGLSGLRFPWGNVINESLANYIGDTNAYHYDLGPNGYNPAFTNGVMPYVSPMGYFASNGYGLYDMAGNVYEWCWDWYGVPYAGGTDPRGPASGTYRVVRGGLWDNYAYDARCAARNADVPSDDFNGVGCRCVKGL